jgi:hypothetical protein
MDATMLPGFSEEKYDTLVHGFRSKPRYQQREHARSHGTYTSYGGPYPVPLSTYDSLTQLERSQQFAVRQATQIHLMSSGYTAGGSNFASNEHARRGTALSRNHHGDGEEEKPIPQRTVH